MAAFVFPGQGSQKRGMGQGLFDEVLEYASVEKEVDAMMGYSMRKLCLEDVDNHLKDTVYTQPSLYVVNALHYYKAIGEGLRPTVVAGHSLGEYNALLAAGAFDFLTGLELVKKRGEFMSQAKNGGMGAVIGLSAPNIVAILKESSLTSIDIANYNSPSQIVVSGPTDDINRAGPFFEKAGARLFIQLPVSAAFHSRYVAEAAVAFAKFLTSTSFTGLKLPVIANVTAQPYPVDDSSGKIRSLLVDQITRPVQWTQSILYLLRSGVTEFREIGPGNVLTRFIQQIKQETFV